MHRWSGWPGAWCLDCGASDPVEICLADGHEDECSRPECKAGECKEPGSKRHDPYAAAAEAKKK